MANNVLNAQFYAALALLLSWAFVGGASGGHSTTRSALAGTAGAAGGGALAYQLSDGDIAWTVGGAALGAAAGYGISYLGDVQYREAFAEGYYAGKNQAVKQQYWIIQNLQNPDDWNKNQQLVTRYVPVVIPKQTVGGVTTRQHTEYIEVKERS